MKIGVYGGEAFPIYEIHEDGFSEIEVDEKTLHRWKLAFDTFEKVQQEIIDKLRDQNHDTWSQEAWNGFNI